LRRQSANCAQSRRALQVIAREFRPLLKPSRNRLISPAIRVLVALAERGRQIQKLFGFEHDIASSTSRQNQQRLLI
jgi:hypothetical protein